jgi:hypothetical protein
MTTNRIDISNLGAQGAKTSKALQVSKDLKSNFTTLLSTIMVATIAKVLVTLVPWVAWQLIG